MSINGGVLIKIAEMSNSFITKQHSNRPTRNWFPDAVKDPSSYWRNSSTNNEATRRYFNPTTPNGGSSTTYPWNPDIARFNNPLSGVTGPGIGRTNKGPSIVDRFRNYNPSTSNRSSSPSLLDNPALSWIPKTPTTEKNPKFDWIHDTTDVRTGMARPYRGPQLSPSLERSIRGLSNS